MTNLNRQEQDMVEMLSFGWRVAQVLMAALTVIEIVKVLI